MLHKLLIDFYVIMKYKQRKNLYKYNSKIINPMRVHHLDYIIVLIIAVIAVLVLVYVENNINLSGRSIETIDDFDSEPLANCNPSDKENIIETASSNPYITTIVYFNKCYPRCMKITTIENGVSNTESGCGE